MKHSNTQQIAKLREQIQKLELSGRRTGKTTRFVDSLRDGDVVVSHSMEDARRIQDLAKEKGIDVKASTGEIVGYRQMVRYTDTYLSRKAEDMFKEVTQWVSHMEYKEDKIIGERNGQK